MIRWGIIGCGDVTEVKSGPAFQKVDGSSLVGVMRRDRAKAEDYARRHGVPRVFATAQALIDDPEVDAVYVATPPSSHCELALRVAEARKPCLVEKPMARNHDECLRMIAAFRERETPFWVAYYRRAQPRFLLVRDLLASGRIGQVTSAHVTLLAPLTDREGATVWQFDPAIAGAGLTFDVGSHCVDLLDFFLGPITQVKAFAVNGGGSYSAEDVAVAAFKFTQALVGTATFNFHASEKVDRLVFIGSDGELSTPVFSHDDIVIRGGQGAESIPVAALPHVHQPLIQTIVNELRGHGRCESTPESGARAQWVLDECVRPFYQESIATS